ncbi:hypothetical protein LTR17_004730 [Elasticomyces elasticus]|nr:hypothetical protein LTR17_004730 [Elasticomyces elasticus]
MAASGDLTKSGLLYEGNYTEWRDRIDSLLKVYGMDIDKISQPAHRDRRTLVERQKAAKLISDQVSPALLGRIAATEARDPETLLLSVQAVAKPFRLSNLPPELRIRVYGYYFGSGSSYIWEYGSWRTLENAWESKKDVPHPAVPDLLLASRSFSTEALRFSTRGDIRAETKKAWDKHIASMEVDRKALGLQGEVLILCFTSRPELWID